MLQFDPNEQPKKILKPSTRFWFMFSVALSNSLMQLLFFGIVILISFLDEGIGGGLLNIPFVSTVILILGITAFFIVVLANVGIKFLTLRKTNYKFYSNRVEYYEGFWNQNKHTITYTNITDLGQTNGIIERMFGLGSIQLRTGAGISGVTIKHIQEPDTIYQELTQIITNGSQQPNQQFTQQPQTQQQINQ